MDIPVAGVLADRALTVTYSGFWTTNDTDLTTDASGDITGTEAFPGGWNSDLAVARGLFDFFEFGVNIQSLNDAGEGGNLWGAFGRLSILSPQTQPIGLAVGGRYASSPDFGDGIAYAPNRLGRADRRLRGQLGSREIDTGFSFYAVAGWDLPGLPSSFLPDHDFSFTAGWGNGLFKEGDDLDWYASGDSGGWFAGVAWNLELAESRMLTFMSDYNGFDWNVGTQLDLNGVRLGTHVLGVNHSSNTTVYRSSKFGLIASVALCGRGFCRPSLRDRPDPDVVVVPAAPTGHGCGHPRRDSSSAGRNGRHALPIDRGRSRGASHVCRRHTGRVVPNSLERTAARRRPCGCLCREPSVVRGRRTDHCRAALLWQTRRRGSAGLWRHPASRGAPGGAAFRYGYRWCVT